MKSRSSIISFELLSYTPTLNNLAIDTNIFCVYGVISALFSSSSSLISSLVKLMRQETALKFKQINLASF